MAKLRQIGVYVGLVFKKWTLWLFLVLDIAGAIVQYFVPTFKLPTNVYGLVALVGFAWAGFQVYDELRLSYEQQMRKLSSQLNINAILKTSKLDLKLQEGHEYAWALIEGPTPEETLYLMQRKLSKPRPQKAAPVDTRYFVPNAKLAMFLHVDNAGSDVDLLLISVRCDNSYDIPFSPLLGKAFSADGQELQYPFPLTADETFDCELGITFEPTTYHSQAQFASRIRDIRDKTRFLSMKVTIETADHAGERKEFGLEAQVSTNPLVNLYVEHWKNENQSELMRLAGGPL